MSTTQMMKKSKQVATPYQAINLQALTEKEPMYLFDKWFTMMKKQKSSVLLAGPMMTTPSCYSMRQ